MLRISAPVRLVSSGLPLSLPLGFAERIASGYAVFALRFSPEALLHLMTNEPEQALENRILFQNFVTNRVHDSRVSISLAADFLNRLLLSSCPQFTYQDSVFLSCMLQKLGVKDPVRFLRETRRILEKAAGKEFHAEEIYRKFLQTASILEQVRSSSYQSAERQIAVERGRSFFAARERQALLERLTEASKTEISSDSEQWRRAERFLGERTAFVRTDSCSRMQDAEWRQENRLESQTKFLEQCLTEREYEDKLRSLPLEARAAHRALWRQVFRRLRTQELTQLLERFTVFQCGGGVRTVDARELRFAEERTALARLTHALCGYLPGPAFITLQEHTAQLEQLIERERLIGQERLTEREFRPALKRDLVRWTEPPIFTDRNASSFALEHKKLESSFSHAAFRLERYEREVLCRSLERELNASLWQISVLESASSSEIQQLTAQAYSFLERTAYAEQPARFRQTEAFGCSVELLHKLTALVTDAFLQITQTESAREYPSAGGTRLRTVRSGPPASYPSAAASLQREFYTTDRRDTLASLERALFTAVSRLAACRTTYPMETGPLAHTGWLSLADALPGMAQRLFKVTAPQLTEIDRQQEAFPLIQQQRTISTASAEHIQAQEIQRQQAQVLEAFRSEQILQAAQKSAPLRPDRARTLENSLRALENPEAFLRELQMQSTLKQPSLAQAAPKQADPLTKAVLETAVRVDAIGSDFLQRAEAPTPRIFPADPTAAFREATGQLSSAGAVHPAAQLSERADPPPMPLLHRQTDRAEETPSGGGPPAPVVQKTEHTEKRRTTETIHAVLAGSPLLAETRVQSTEDIGMLVARAVSKQIGAITERVSGNLEKRLRADKARRGL